VAAGAAAGLGALGLSEPEQDVLRKPMPMRMLGRTRARVSIIGLGSAPLGHSFQSQETFDRVVGEAIDLGINYIDTATIYDIAQERLGAIVKRNRDKLFVATKTRGMTRDQAIATVEESLRLLQTDHVDLVHLHNIGDFDVDRLLDEKSPLRGLQEARKRGLLRFIGVSGHQRVSKMADAVRTGEIDVIMPALNFVDQHIYAYETHVLPEARKQRAGIVAMKVLGGAPKFSYRTPVPCYVPKERVDDAIRYALGLDGVATAVIGFNFVEQVRQAVSVAKSFRRLSQDESKALEAEGRKLADAWGLHLGPV
jgi:aryl-alcohol dehydrogenase-like predicted oxidoreductase